MTQGYVIAIVTYLNTYNYNCLLINKQNLWIFKYKSWTEFTVE